VRGLGRAFYHAYLSYQLSRAQQVPDAFALTMRLTVRRVRALEVTGLRDLNDW
jgi:hypothetical protein